MNVSGVVVVVVLVVVVVVVVAIVVVADIHIKMTQHMRTKNQIIELQTSSCSKHPT